MQNVTCITICSANYLAHAKTLGESVRRHHPEIRFVIGLVDRLPTSLPVGFLDSWEIIPVERLELAAFDDMAARYNVIELNTAVKPFFMEYLYEHFDITDSVIYIDPDIMLTARMDTVLDRLMSHHIILTPHSSTPDNSPSTIDFEQGMLTTGIYNLGFVATSRSEETLQFLRWWQRRLSTHCYFRPGAGLFVDQLWAILAPVYFTSTFVERDVGYNMAYWNLFERKLSPSDTGYVVNETTPLVFFHFSSFNPDRPDKLTTRQWPAAIPTFADRPDLIPLFHEYRAAVLRNGYRNVQTLRCQLDITSRPSTHLTTSWTHQFAAKALQSFPPEARAFMKRIGNFVSRNCTL